jgi:hypothetical protein
MMCGLASSPALPLFEGRGADIPSPLGRGQGEGVPFGEGQGERLSAEMLLWGRELRRNATEAEQVLW